MDQDINLWYESAMDQPSAHRYFDTSSGKLHALEWGSGQKHLVILVHGALAHGHCWDFVAPFLVDDERRVLAIDLSGMGDSDWCDQYSYERHVENILDVYRLNHGYETVTLIGHSYGGIVTLLAFHQLIKNHHSVRLIMVDVFLSQLNVKPSKSISMPTRPIRYYPDYETASKRFRLIPKQPVSHPQLLNHLAYHSLRQTPEGWCWKFDPKLYGMINANHASGRPNILKDIKPQAEDIYFIYGEYTSPSLIKMAHQVMQDLGVPQHLFVIDQAYHHVMLDHPLSLTEVIQKILL